MRDVLRSSHLLIRKQDRTRPIVPTSKPVKMKVYVALTSLAFAWSPAAAGTCSATCDSWTCPSPQYFEVKSGSTGSYTPNRGVEYCTSRYGAGSHNYLSSIVISAVDDSKLGISFQNAAYAPAPANNLCYYGYSSSIGNSATYTTDVGITVQCNNYIYTCKFNVQANYACFIPCCSSSTSSITCKDGTTRTVVTYNGQIGYYPAGSSTLQLVNQCNSTNTTSSPTTSPPSTTSSTSSGSSFTSGMDKTFKRIAISGSALVDPTTCAYRCSRGYRVTVAGSVITFKPALTISGCDCYTLTASLGKSIALDIDNLHYVVTYDTATSPNVFLSLSSGGLSMTFAPGTPSFSFQSMQYTRTSTTCNVPDSCDYQCSTGYSLTLVGDDKIQAISTASTTTCSCASLTAVILDNSTAVGVSGSTSYVWSTSGNVVQVDASISGTICRGSYSQTGSSGASALSLTTSVLAFMVGAFLVTLA